MNRESYDSIARQWDASRASFVKDERRYLELLLEDLTAPASILDLGCGTGRPMAEWALARGHRVTGIDQSDALLDIARQRFPQATWIHARIEDLPFTGLFHAAICWDSLFHIERAHHAPILSALYDHLVPGAKVMLTTGGSRNPPFTDTMFDREFFYDSLPPDDIRELLTGIGFEQLVHEFMDLPGTGRDRGRIAIVARKPVVELGRASADDAAVITEMENAPDTSRFIMAYSPDEHRRRMTEPDHIYLRILVAGQIVGFFLLVLDPDGTSVEFRRMVVRDRGLGIGQAAIARMERFCHRELRRSRIWLDVFEDNRRARHIYEKLGYQPFGDRDYGGRRLLLYEKRLTTTSHPAVA